MNMKVVKAMLVMVLIASTSVIYAQQRPPMNADQKKEHKAQKEERMEKFKAMKVEYITSKLELTSAEAEQFWPVYNELMEKIHQLEVKRMKAAKEAKKKGELSDKEVEDMIALNFEIEQEILNLKKAYDLKFKEVLPMQKVGKLYLAEKQFKREVMRKMKEEHRSAQSPK